MANLNTLPAPDSPEMQALTFGALTKVFPRAQVTAALTKYQRHNKHACKLPATFLVYYVVALGLNLRLSTREVLRWLLHGLRLCWGEEHLPTRVAGKSGISTARARLGWDVLAELFTTCVRPLATPETQGAFYRGLRLMGIDGTVLATQDTPANTAAFGKTGSKHGASAYPLLRLVALVELGTHAIVGAVLGGWRQGETTLARQLLSQLGSGMLLLADRNFFSRALWCATADTGAALLWRVKAGTDLPCQHVLPDGSYLTTVYPTVQEQRRGTHGHRARVIEYTLASTGETYRLVTTVLAPEEAPAVELAALYPERWEEESAIGEVKTVLRGGDQILLRSRTPDLVRQEVYGLLLAHYTVRTVMHDTALYARVDPDRLSFRHTLHVLRRTLPEGAALSPRGSGMPGIDAYCAKSMTNEWSPAAEPGGPVECGGNVRSIPNASTVAVNE